LVRELSRLKYGKDVATIEAEVASVPPLILVLDYAF